MWGCGESVKPQKLNTQDVQGALSSRPKGHPGLLLICQDFLLFYLFTRFGSRHTVNTKKPWKFHENRVKNIQSLFRKHCFLAFFVNVHILCVFFSEMSTYRPMFYLPFNFTKYHCSTYHLEAMHHCSTYHLEAALMVCTELQALLSFMNNVTLMFFVKIDYKKLQENWNCLFATYLLFVLALFISMWQCWVYKIPS